MEGTVRPSEGYSQMGWGCNDRQQFRTLTLVAVCRADWKWVRMREGQVISARDDGV